MKIKPGTIVKGFCPGHGTVYGVSAQENLIQNEQDQQENYGKTYHHCTNVHPVIQYPTELIPGHVYLFKSDIASGWERGFYVRDDKASVYGYGKLFSFKYWHPYCLELWAEISEGGYKI